MDDVSDDGWADGTDNVNNVGEAGSQAKPFTESPASARFRERMNAHHAKYKEELDARREAEYKRASAERTAQKKARAAAAKKVETFIRRSNEAVGFYYAQAQKDGLVTTSSVGFSTHDCGVAMRVKANWHDLVVEATHHNLWLDYKSRLRLDEELHRCGLVNYQPASVSLAYLGDMLDHCADDDASPTSPSDECDVWFDSYLDELHQEPRYADYYMGFI